MDDEQLIALFEAGAAPPEGFHHAHHVRVAWWYLRQSDLPSGLIRFSGGLRRFAAANGKPDLFHETITTAFVLLIQERLCDGARDLDWDAFAAANPDLLAWRPSILDRYYRPETLASERARRGFVMPDRVERREGS